MKLILNKDFMPEEYDHITAFHYSAFRPPLHKMILDECLENTGKFCMGLDIGCGTGQSSIALTNFCNKVIGIDPSEGMLKKSIIHPNIEYRPYNKRDFNFVDDLFDLATFAGSLYYAKSQKLLDEVVRVTKCGSKIIVYDFELLLDVIIEKINLNNLFREKSLYDHQVNFSELNQEKIQLNKKSENHLSLEISISNLSHLLLSSKDNYNILNRFLGKENLYKKVNEQLYSKCKTEKILIDAKSYLTVYQNIK
jgi:SAM-dependent methyltransferase